MDRRTLTKHLLALGSLGMLADMATTVKAPAEAALGETPKPDKGRKFQIRVLVYDGADDIDFVAPMEVFGFAATQHAGIDVALVTLAPQAIVASAFALNVSPNGVLTGVPDLLLVPGGGWVNHSPQGVRAEIARGKILEVIRAAHAAGSIVAGACTGAMALAAAGLLDGRPATTHHGAIADLRRTKARVVEARVVDDGNILTCGGVTSTFDLALWLTERFWGEALAARVADYLEYTRSPDVYRG
jgi:transcriptional regulator GlxA family with amidase domain